MGNFARGKQSLSISDRSGQAFSLCGNGKRMEWFLSSYFRV
jgi:hypothetical protein